MARRPVRRKGEVKTVGEILALIESRAPSRTAESWDNVGLLCGDPLWKTQGVVIAVDLSDRAIETARAKGYRLIVNHHPCIFPKNKGLSKVTSGGLVHKAIRYGIAVAAYHTNFDRCALEVVEAVSSGLGVVPKGRLLEDESESLMKLVVFVPQSHLDPVREAICQAGAGQIGDYDYCTFSTQGEGTFRGGEASKPFLGVAGQKEKVSEYRLETVFPRGLEDSVLEAMFSAHPYEEVAYDLYELRQKPGRVGLVRGLGYGFWGDFSQLKSFSDLSRSVNSLFNVDGFWVTDSIPSRVRRVAFVAGKGASFLDAAVQAGCDLFITGEAGYHAALGGARRGMAVMEIGHTESERYFLPTVKKWLALEGIRSVTLDLSSRKAVWPDSSS